MDRFILLILSITVNDLPLRKHWHPLTASFCTPDALDLSRGCLCPWSVAKNMSGLSARGGFRLFYRIPRGFEKRICQPARARHATRRIGGPLPTLESAFPTENGSDRALLPESVVVFTL
jgi:hypothetical protein